MREKVATEAARGVVERAVEGTGVAAQVERGVVERAVESEWVEWTAEVKVVVRAEGEEGRKVGVLLWVCF